MVIKMSCLPFSRGINWLHTENPSVVLGHESVNGFRVSRKLNVVIYIQLNI